MTGRRGPAVVDRTWDGERAVMRDQAKGILAALGGVANIVDIEPCTTRLRSQVRDPALVDAVALRAAGHHGVMVRGRVVQVVVGPAVDVLASEIEELL